MNTNESKTTKTELVFILDKSGSMSGLESDTIGGYNAMLKKQQQASGAARVTTVLFDDVYEVLHDRIIMSAAALPCWMQSEKPSTRLPTPSATPSRNIGQIRLFL
jgi:hypothetical protein